jgi:RNA recognition motif-containing protein
LIILNTIQKKNGQEEIGMAKNLYVGNLSSEVTQEDLKENFKEVGEVVSAVVIKDKFTGESKGFGFVEMGTDKEAQDAIQKFNGGELCGKKIVVSEARLRPDQRGGGRFGGGRRPGGGRPGGGRQGGGGFGGRGRY